MLNFKEWIKVRTVDWLNEKPGRKTGLGVFDFEWKPRNPNHWARQNNTIWLFKFDGLTIHLELHIMTSSSLLTRYQGTPSQDKGIRSSNQDQCTAHNATIVLPHLHHNCQTEAFQQRIHNLPSYHKALLGKNRSLIKLFIGNPKQQVLTKKTLVKQQ